MARRERALIVTADDFGAGKTIDRGIRAAVAAGRVSAVSALTNYPGAGAAIRDLRRSHPEVGIGVHLNLTSGHPISAPSLLGGICDPHGAFRGLPVLLDRLHHLDMSAIARELRLQVDLVQETLGSIDHLSSHHNVLGIYPPFQELMMALSREYNAPMRTPVAVSQTHSHRYGYATTRRRAAVNILGLVGRRPFRAARVLPGTWLRLMNSKRLLRRDGVLHPDHMIDAFFGNPTRENLRHILSHLPPGVSELVVHLAELPNPPTAYEIPEGIDGAEFANRDAERQVLLGEDFDRILTERGIRRTTFDELRARAGRHR